MRVLLFLIVGAVGFTLPVERPVGRCAVWSGAPAVLAEGRALAGSGEPRWRDARIVYDIRRSRSRDVRVVSDSTTCQRALSAYEIAARQGAGGVPGLPDSLPLRLIVVQGPGFFLVEDSSSATRTTEGYEVLVFGPDWKYRISYGVGA